MLLGLEREAPSKALQPWRIGKIGAVLIENLATSDNSLCFS